MTPPQLIEDAIVALIVPIVAGFAIDVAPIPSKPSEYARAVDRSTIWVAMHGIKGGEEKSASNLYQENDYTFEVVLNARSLRDDAGIYHMYHLVMEAIAGKRPYPGTGWLRLTQLQSNGEQDGVFNYSLFVSCPGLPLVESVDTTDGDGANLTETNFNY